MNKKQPRSLLIGIMVAVGIASGVAISARQLVLGQCGTGPGQLNCFDPFAAGEMWRSLDTIGERTTPNLIDGTDEPENAEDLEDEDEFGSPIWVSNAEEFDEAYAELSNGECAFSHLGDPLEFERGCKDANGLRSAPPLGQLLYPSGVAVYKDRVYVSDRMNHRVQVLDFFGTPLPITRPMGNGQPGTGNYDTTQPYRNPFGTGNLVGNKLFAPNGLAVDSLGRVLVADGGNARVIIFDGNTGSPAFTNETASRVIIPPGVAGEPADEVIPTSVAISPNTAVVRPGTAPANADARIVVLDRYRCSMNVYDAGFRFLWRYPQVRSTQANEDSACVDPEVSNAPGNFSLMLGATIDAQGRIYVVDPYNNRVQVFTRGALNVPGTLIGTFGAPVLEPGQPMPIEALETPSSILLDHNGRIVVNDSDNLRIAFFDVTFGVSGSGNPPVSAKFLFEVPAPGDDVVEFPTGLAEQHGTLEEGLDPAGRYLKVDTAGQRLQRLELADLAIVQASAHAGEGFFNVAVPSEKANAVGLVKANVVPSVDGTYPGVTITSIETLSPAASNGVGNNIVPGAWVKYRFTYSDPNELPEIKFTITAVGNKETPQDTEAPPVEVLVRGDCDTCDARADVYVTPAPTPESPTPASDTTTTTGDWFGQKVFARLTPVESTVGEVTHIEWTVTGSDIVYYGHGVHRTSLPVGARWVDVPIIGKESIVTFWAVTAENTVGPTHERKIQVDLDPPVILYSNFAPSVFVDSLDGTAWWKADVTATTTIKDDYSGTAATGGTVLITGEGRDLVASVSATDYVGHTATVRSNALSRGGRIVNIDRTPPVLVPPLDLTLTAGPSGFANVPSTFMATATDALSGLQGTVTRSGPATVTAGVGAVTFTFTATDRVGHVATTTARITVGAFVNRPPTAVNDSATGAGAAPINISVLGNDSDPDLDTLAVTAVTQPAAGAAEGVASLSGNVVVFTPAPGFVGTTSFTYTISDGRGGTAEATVTVTVTAAQGCIASGYLTYSQGGWGNSGAPGQFLAAKFSQVYPSGVVIIGGAKTLTFQGATAIRNFLPSGGSAAALTSSVVNPTGSQGGQLAAQLLALKLAVDFSAAGATKSGLGQLVMQSGPFAGVSVNDIVAVANAVLGGQSSVLPSGVSLSSLASILESLNMNFHEGTVNNGLLGCPGQCVAGTIALSADSFATSGTAGNTRTFSGPGVLVKASAFSRVKNTGVWNTAFLGAFGAAGLGVTDGSEGSGADDSHKTDNIGDRLNFLVFQFSRPVVVTRAFLDYLGADGDATIWVGTRPESFTTNIVLSDALLGGLGAAQSNTSTSTADRWATFNNGRVAANVLVIAADVTDTTPEDQFKVSKLDIVCATPALPPVVAASNQNSEEGATVSVQFAAADPDDQDLTYSASGLPPGLSINAATGLVTGTLGYASASTYNVTLTVTDEDNQTATTTFVWTVANKNRPPAVTAANRTDNKGTAVSFQLAGSDPDSDALTYSASGLPPGAAISTSGAISGTLTTAGTYAVIVTVNDPANATGTATFTWTVKSVNRAPTVSVPDRTDNKGAAPTVQVTGADLDGDSLTYSATGLPPSVTMSTAGKITGTLTTVGTYTVTVTVKDPSNATGTDSFIWTVKGVNVAPDAKNDTLKTTKNTPRTISVVGNDSDVNGDSLTITAVSTPSKGSVVKYSNGTIKYTPPSNWVGTTSFSYTISDGRGGSDTATVSVTVSSHSDSDDCRDDHDHNGSRGDRNDYRERDCDRNHRHNDDCDRRR